ncbi:MULTISPECIES: aldo/keto reductase [unclassified Rathayibacter]|uniref:aldo/keto reductase n=1 Tax=unclassified Rathayibacter TaxID=2609250 RepID=UPI00188B2327|nr:MULTISPECIES: aldo/keto reductase [unclassified Rathayibacter]MBF4463557.1 aldo/keto reductase [Rathayibacter sp. VKM Ac-2879]MBF4504993.1 aldo/keto reductase [Rathayibacter sp. VKM Ac-2878]
MTRVRSGATEGTARHGAVKDDRRLGTIPPVDASAVTAIATLRRSLGDTGAALFPLVLDAAVAGRRAEHGGPGLLERFSAWGGNGVLVTDTAGSEAGEEEVGRWVGGHRDRFLLVGRFGASVAAAPSPRALVASVEGALRRLRTDRLDVLAVRPDGAGRLDELLTAVDVLLSRGLVRAVVASGFAAEELFEARVLAAHGLPRFAAVEVRYNVLEREEAEGDVGLVAAAQGLSLLSTVPLAHGFLHGAARSRRELARLPEGALASAHLGRRGRRMLAALDAIGAELSAAPAAVALAWLLARPGIAAATVDPRSASDVDAMMRGVSLYLDEGHLAALERARR